MTIKPQEHAPVLAWHRAFAVDFLFPRTPERQREDWVNEGVLDSGHWRRAEFTAIHDLAQSVANVEASVGTRIRSELAEQHAREVAEAWDAGRAAGVADCVANVLDEGCEQITPNPHRKSEA